MGNLPTATEISPHPSHPQPLTSTTQTPLQEDPPANPVNLHPIDQHVLELTGNLPGLPLLVNPEILRRLRAPPSSVHTIETSSIFSTRGAESPDPPTSDPWSSENGERQAFTYRGYLLKPRIATYTRALEIYAAVDGSFGGKFSTRLQMCRKYAFFVQNKLTKKLRVQSSRCKLRWCPICRDVSRMIVTAATEEWLKLQDYPKMITLTLKHSDDPLALQIKRIYKCFQKLKTRAYFQRLITGGVWFFQLKFNPTTEQWHPHIHCLVAGQYLPHARLKQLWSKITGDSTIVDIRPVKDLEGCSNEVARYATSPADIAAVTFEQAKEIFYATKHRRICGSWGSAKSITLKPTVQDDGDMWTKVADFYFINVKKEFDPHVREFWKCFKQNKAYEGPQVQKLTDVYHDELDVLLSVGYETMTYDQFQNKIRQSRNHKWKSHFEQSNWEYTHPQTEGEN